MVKSPVTLSSGATKGEVGMRSSLRADRLTRYRPKGDSAHSHQATLDQLYKGDYGTIVTADADPFGELGGFDDISSVFDDLMYSFEDELGDMASFNPMEQTELGKAAEASQTQSAAPTVAVVVVGLVGLAIAGYVIYREVKEVVDDIKDKDKDKEEEEEEEGFMVDITDADGNGVPDSEEGDIGFGGTWGVGQLGNSISLGDSSLW